jgi:hypothetical protein
MSLPSFEVVRDRIEAIPNLGLNRYFKTLHNTGSRCGELAGLSFPSDKGKPTGNLLSVSESTFQFDMMNFEDIMVIKAIKQMDEGIDISNLEIAKIRESVAVFHIVTEKRMGFERYTALPLNPLYDVRGWTRQIFDYIKERQGLDEPVFPYHRQQLYPVAREVFKGLTYPIVTYKNHQGVLIKAHQKFFADHACRHERATELKTKYRIKGEMLDSFMGWTKQRGGASSPMQDKYVLEPWKEQGYFPRLLRRWN